MIKSWNDINGCTFTLPYYNKNLNHFLLGCINFVNNLFNK